MKSTCPNCKIEHFTESKYSNTVCEPCLKKYKPKNPNNEPVSFIFENDILYSIHNDVKTCDYECTIHEIPCYPTVNKDGKIFLVSSIKINKHIDKLKEHGEINEISPNLKFKRIRSSRFRNEASI